MSAPQAVMLTLDVMDSEEKTLGNYGPFPAVPIDDLVFIKIDLKDMSREEVQTMVASLESASMGTNKTFVILPPEAEILRAREQWGSFPDQIDRGEDKGE